MEGASLFTYIYIIIAECRLGWGWWRTCMCPLNLSLISVVILLYFQISFPINIVVTTLDFRMTTQAWFYLNYPSPILVFIFCNPFAESWRPSISAWRPWSNFAAGPSSPFFQQTKTKKTNTSNLSNNVIAASSILYVSFSTLLNVATSMAAARMTLIRRPMRNLTGRRRDVKSRRNADVHRSKRRLHRHHDSNSRGV